MPLPKPRLDNRNFDQLVGEGRGLIPRLAPGWTDHNYSDSGIALIELAAWLAEQNIYRFDRVSPEVMRAFLALVGEAQRPAQTAKATVTIGNATGAIVVLPEAMQLAAEQQPLFETMTPVSLSTASLIALYAGKAAEQDVYEASKTLQPFEPFGTNARRGHALYIGFDQPLAPPGTTLSLYVWTDRHVEDIDVRARLIAEYEAARQRAQRTCPEQWAHATDWRLHYRVRTLWEYHTGNQAWQPLPQVEDETRALSMSGFVRFAAPTGHAPGGTMQNVGAYFIRCRILSGRFECPPRLLHVGFNAVQVEHAVTQAERMVGVSRGHAGERYALSPSVVPGSTRLRWRKGTEEDANWREVMEWDRVGPHDACYRLEAKNGEVQYGNGLSGAVPRAQWELHAAWKTGAGAGGNVPAGSLDDFAATAHNDVLVPGFPTVRALLHVDQPFAASGGADAESLMAAQARAVERVARPEKAVTLGDYEMHAQATSGVPVARAWATAGHHPALPCYPAPGVVTVAVIPRCPARRPRPSAAMLHAVARYLSPRRLVTTDLHVIAPRYRRIAVHATLHAACAVDATRLKSDAIDALDAFLNPLHGGPAGDGWPVGRTVYRTEILALLARLDGVARVTDIGLQSRGDGAPRCDNIVLCPDELPTSGRHRIEVVTETMRPDLQRSIEHEC